jgi:CPA1 family monovalent cation:H+ antiporter
VQFEVLVLVAVAAAVAGLARRLKLSAPLLLVVAGIVASFLPGVGDFELEPDIILFFVLPPLLFGAAWQSSVINFRQNIRPIGLLSVGLVLFTTLAVGFTVHAVLPDLPLAAAFTLGAIVSPPDAVAATAVGRSVGMPRRLITILAGESLVNDATALTAYRVTVGAAVAGGFSIWTGIAEFLVAAIGGVAVGLVIAVVAENVLQHLHDPVVENSLVLLLPFVTYAAAEELGRDGYHGSGVLAVVAAGLYLGHRSPRRLTAATRLQGTEVWRVIEFLLESVVFALIGLQLPTVLDQLPEGSTGTVAVASVVALVVTIAARFAWIYPATYLRPLQRKEAAKDPPMPWTYPTVLAWAGMRGVVSLAAAFGLPADFPQRSLILFLTFVVVVGTLLIQGLTLPALVRRLGVTSTEEQQDLIREAGAQHAAANAALARLDEELTNTTFVPEDVVSRLREKAEIRQLGAWERLGGRGTPDGAAIEPPTVSFRRLRRSMIDAEREVFIDLRDRGQIDDEVLLRVQRELDLEESILMRE